MLQIIFPLLVAFIGLLLKFLASNDKVREIGHWMFVCGLFWSVSPFVTKGITVLGG